MTIFSTADETRRQARESKEKGVPSSRDALPKIEGETGYYIDTFSPDPSNSSGGTETSTQENAPNVTDDGDSATNTGGSGGGGTNKTTFNPEDPTTMAQPEGSYTSANSLEEAKTAPTNGEPCIGCDVDKLDNITEGPCSGGSGDCVKIHYDGVFPTPEGWADPNTPEEIEYDGWILGEAWRTGSDQPLYATPEEVWVSELDAHFNDGQDTYVYSYNGYNRAAERINYTKYREETGETVTGYASCQVISCTPSESSASCPTAAPTYSETSWPADGCYDLVFDGTAFKGSDLDPDLPAKYKGDGTSKVDYCTSGGADGSTVAGVNGGYQIQTTDMMRYYDSDGKMRAAGDKTQTFIDQYKP